MTAQFADHETPQRPHSGPASVSMTSADCAPAEMDTILGAFAGPALPIARMRPSDVLYLQRTIGNARTVQFLAARRQDLRPAVQRYTIEDVTKGTTSFPGVKVSANRKVLLLQDRKTLFATLDLITQANNSLAQVGRGSAPPPPETPVPGGSYISLGRGDLFEWGGRFYFKVIPRFRFTPYYPQEDFNRGDAHYHRRFFEAAQPGGRDTYQAKGETQAQELEQKGRGDDATALREFMATLPTDRMPLWADCSKASALITGSNDAYTGRQAVFYQGSERRIAEGRGRDQDYPDVRYKGHANKLAHELYRVQISYFIRQPGNRGYLTQGTHYTGPSDNPTPITPTSPRQAKEMYHALTPDGREAFDREARINDYANPAIGEAYAIATEPEMPGYSEQGQHVWNQHWAGVVMKDGNDTITMEGYAHGGGLASLLDTKEEDILARDWVFDMYGVFTPGGTAEDRAKTFHSSHLSTGTHGTHATTMGVRSTI